MIREYLNNKWLIVQILMIPISYILGAFLLYRGSIEKTDLIFIIFGSGIMGIWTTTLMGAGISIEYERRQGLLEYIITTPSSMSWIVLGKTIINALIGTLIYIFIVPIFLIFKFPIYVHFSFPIIIIFLLIIISFVAIGQLLSFFFLFSKNANPVINALSYALYVLCGLLFPLAILPTPLNLISFLIPASYGMKALNELYIHDWNSSICINVGIMLLLTFIYFLIAYLLYAYIEYRARVRGDIGGI